MSKSFYVKILFAALGVVLAVCNFSLADEALIIPAETITQDVSFIPVEVDGRKMEVIAVRDSQGQIRTAFNTCQVCYGSERAYYEQSGSSLVCQNCGNRFPIYESQRVISDDKVIIPHELLKDAKEIFTGWRTEY